MARKTATAAKGQKRVYEQAGKVISDKAIKDPDFRPAEAHVPKYCSQADRWFIFSQDQAVLEGYLAAGPITNHRRNSSYVLETHAGETVEFYGNRLLHALIRHGDAVGKWVKIEFVGTRHIRGYARQQKVYRLWIDKGTVNPKLSEVSAKQRKPKRK